MKKYYFIIFIILLFFPPAAKGAILYLDPASGSYNVGDTFLVEVRLDTQGEYINAIDVQSNYPQDVLEFTDFSKGNSVLSLWVKEPNLAEDSPPLGLISFSGGIPGGYQGKDGLLGTMVFRVVDVKHLQLEFLESSKVLLNDGKGTEAKLTIKGAVFEILTGEGGKNEWQEKIEKDKILPEPFKIELGQSPDVFDGKYFIIFSTTDKQTGLDRYEVKEGGGKWKTASSPYVLKNQKLTSDISVKAIDKAGNFWMETLEAQNPEKIGWEAYAVLGLILIVVMIILWVLRRKK